MWLFLIYWSRDTAHAPWAFWHLERMPSVSSGYSAADTFSDDRIDAIQQQTARQGCAFT